MPSESALAAVENLELLFSQNCARYFQITFPGSPAEHFLRMNVPADQLVLLPLGTKPAAYKSLYFHEEKMLGKRQLAGLLKEKRVTAFVPNTRASQKYATWAEQNNLKLIGPDWKLQKKLEDKIHFDKLLRTNNIPLPRGAILHSSADAAKWKIFPCVLQTRHGNGALRTFFIRDRAALQKFLVDPPAAFPLLCREYIDGLPLGVSVILGKKKMIFSALRLQIIFPEDSGTFRYAGTQWLKKSSLPAAALRNLEKALQKLGRILQKMGYRGVANFDFMLRDEQIFFLECNPRLSGATPTLSAQPELLHGLDFAEQFIRSILSGEPEKDLPFLPETHYEGGAIDLDFYKNEWNGRKVSGVIPNGVYSFQSGKWQFVSEALKDFHLPERLLLFHNLLQGMKVTPGDSCLGMLFFHEPLGVFRNGKYVLSASGKKLLAGAGKNIWKSR